MNYEKEAKRLKLKFKHIRYNEEFGVFEYLTREYTSKIGVIRINYNRTSKYDVIINQFEDENPIPEFFTKKKALIDFLVSVDAKYVQKYWLE